MPKLRREDILHVAELARLKIPESEIETFLAQFNEIVGYVEKLSEIDTKGIEEASVGGLPSCASLAPDEIAPSFTPDEALRGAPDRQEVFFKVPRVIGEEEPS